METKTYPIWTIMSLSAVLLLGVSLQLKYDNFTMFAYCINSIAFMYSWVINRRETIHEFKQDLLLSIAVICFILIGLIIYSEYNPNCKLSQIINGLL